MTKSLKIGTNLILTFVVLLLITEFFPEIATTTDTKSLIITTLLYALADFVLAIILLVIGLVCGLVIMRFSLSLCLLVIYVLQTIAIVGSVPFRLYLISTYYSGFQMADTIFAYVVLTIILGFFTFEFQYERG